MTMDSFQLWARRHLRWLLCLALVLPAAQVAGALHAMAHALAPAASPAVSAAVSSAVSSAGSGALRLPHDGASAQDPCALCVVAAALGAGGATSAQALPAVPADRVEAAAPPSTPLPALARRLPANRGPPSLPA